MPANLTPDYLAAEKVYRNAKSPLEKIAALEEMLAVMPKHKGTDHLRADLRTKIAKLTQSLDKKSATQRTSMLIEKVGAAQVVILGCPNSGKSLIVSSLTKATPEVADYPFTTHIATPGMMTFENVQIQLIDTPPITEQPPEWWLLNIIRRADALLLVVDLSQEPLDQIEILLNLLKEKQISIGQDLSGTDEDTVVSVKKGLLVANKSDMDDGSNFSDLQTLYGEQLSMISASALSGGLDELRTKIFRMLNVIRVYTKPPGGKPDMTDPIVLETGSTLEDAAVSVHKDFGKKMKYARIWGSGKHDGVMAKRDHALKDGDIIELHA